MDHLDITELRVKAHIGVYTWEQHILQDLLFDIRLPLVNTASLEDHLSNTVDYAAVCQAITTFVETHHFKLIETVAEEVALLIKKEFSVSSLTLKVSKPHAVPGAKNISVTLYR